MKFCPECGYKLTGTPKFCPECGAKLQGESASPAGGTDWEAELADIGEKLDEQIGEYENKLALAKSYVLREKYAEAEKAYEELIEKNPQDIAGYIGLICTATGNYTKYEGWEIDKAIRIAQRVAGNAVLQSVVLPKGVTAIGEYAFSECKNLKSISLPAGVQKIGDFAFFCCDRLKAITIPAAITAIGTGTFQGCKNLTNVTLPAGMEKIGESAFSECDNLTNVTLPAGVKEIGAYAFAGCGSLTSITLPAGVKEIGRGAFNGCTSLKTVTIPDGVKEIGNSAFNGCDNLKKVIMSTHTHFGDWAFPDDCEIVYR